MNLNENLKRGHSKGNSCTHKVSLTSESVDVNLSSVMILMKTIEQSFSLVLVKWNFDVPFFRVALKQTDEKNSRQCLSNKSSL